MKKFIISIMMLVMVFAMTACGNENTAGTQQAGTTANTAANSQTSAERSSEASSQLQNTESEKTTMETETSAAQTEVLTEAANGTQAGEEKAAAAETTAAGKKALVVYFSWSGNTRSIANEIQAQTGADIFELVSTTPYSSDYNTVLNEAKTEQSNQARPKISGTISNFDSYDVVYVGFPNWWGDMPMILYSFFDEYDLSGKTIAPFVSSGGSGFSGALATMKSLEPGAQVLDGLSLSSSASARPQNAVSEWLSK